MDNRPHLSATQISMMLRCPRQFAFRYVEGLKSPPSGAMKQSVAWHSTVKKNYRQKMKTQTDLPLDEMTDFYAQTFDDEFQREEVILDKENGETLGGLKDQGVVITKLHHTEIAPAIQPAMVEERRTVSLGKDDFAYDLMFIMDLVDSDSFVRDNKAMARTPNQDDLDKDIQLSTYSLGYRILQRQEHGDEAKPEAGLKIDAIIKTKTPKAITMETQRSREGLRLHLNNIGHIAKQIKAEAFPMNPTGWWCSKKFCGYWDRCMGKAMVTVDLGENLTQQLEDSIAKVEGTN